MRPSVNTGLRTVIYTLATGTALARVEAEIHYATDVLVGAALGNFISRFIHDAFLGLREDQSIGLSIAPEQVSLRFGVAF
jgi:membrane-associated phospholipid phosphatase